MKFACSPCVCVDFFQSTIAASNTLKDCQLTIGPVMTTRPRCNPAFIQHSLESAPVSQWKKLVEFPWHLVVLHVAPWYDHGTTVLDCICRGYKPIGVLKNAPETLAPGLAERHVPTKVSLRRYRGIQSKGE